MSSESIFDKKWNDATEGEVVYVRPSVASLVSALLGLGTFLVYISPWFFFLGVVAIVLSLCAFWAIRNADGILTGTPFAYVGLCSAVFALVSVTVFWQAYHYGLRQEADQFFRLWFAAVQEGDIPRLVEYGTIYSNRSRAADAEEWWRTQYENRFTHRAVHQFVENELIRVLLALSNTATITYYKTSEIISEPEKDTVITVYAVTFTAESGETETFFVRITGQRSFPWEFADFKTAGWQVVGTPVFYFPETL